MLDRNVILTVCGALISVIVIVAYTWANWVTGTLITVEKRTEIMSVKIDYISDSLDKLKGIDYGYQSSADGERNASLK